MKYISCIRYLQRYISQWCTIKDLQESTILPQLPNPTSLAPARFFRVAFDYLVSSDSPTTYPLTPAFIPFSRSPSFSCRHGCSSRGREIDPIGPGSTAAEGFWTSTFEDFIEGFPKSRRRFWPARHHPRRRRRRRCNEEAVQLVGFEGDDPEERGRRILVSL